MSVHYKFNAAKEFDTLPVDGLHISLLDLKQAISHNKRLGGGDVCDLQVTNAETKEVYSDDKMLIPKNSSLIIARVPIDPSVKKFGDHRESRDVMLTSPEFRMNTEGADEAEKISRKLEEMSDLTRVTGTEDDKISAMMAQSTIAYHPSRYLKLRNTVMSGKVPYSYKCYKCHQGGHWVSNCPFNNQDLRKSTGIPSRYLQRVDDPKTPGVMITAQGHFVIFRQQALAELTVPAHVRNQIPHPPKEYECLLCKLIMQDAVLTPCCANAFCDECIRNHLLDSDDHECPECKSKDVSPDTLVPNRYLRLNITQFGSQFLTELPKPHENGIDSPVITGSPSIQSVSPAPLPNSPDIASNDDDMLALTADTNGQKTVEPKASVISDAMTENVTRVSRPPSVQISSDEDEEGKGNKKKKKKKKEEKDKDKKHRKKEKERKKSKGEKEGKKEKEKRRKHSRDDSSPSRSNVDSPRHLKESDSEKSDLANVSTDNLMNEALLPSNFDPTVPPPGMAMKRSPGEGKGCLVDITINVFVTTVVISDISFNFHVPRVKFRLD